MPSRDRIKQRIEARISQGEFLVGLLRIATEDSAQVQEQFVGELSRIAGILRELLENNGLIHRLPYRPADFWKEQRGRTIAFVDGGVANIDLPSAAPIGIRVGSYIVRPGDDSKERERFNIELSLVDDIYSPHGQLFDDDFDDIAKLRDAARMVSETAVGYSLAKATPRIDTILLHGPLVNPVAPYGLEGFPTFGTEACRRFFADDQWSGTDADREFVPVYLELLERTRKTGVPVLGVVERSIGKDPVVLKRLLAGLQDRRLMKKAEVAEVTELVVRYGLNDTSLFDVVLAEGEYSAPVLVNRQGPESKWPERWKPWIREYPPALTTYLKPSETVLPFRVEGFEDTTDLERALDLVLHTSRLLPSYGFPVGLDIVDKFAKVPAWMSRGVKGQHQVVLIRKALESGDPRAIAFAKRVLAAKSRDWLFRPTA